MIEVVLCSPGDVAEERDAFRAVIDEANRIVANAGLIFVLRAWEDVPPGRDGRGVQARIEGHLEIDKCDVLVAVFWKRLGTVDASGEYPTLREIRAATAPPRVRNG